MDSLCISRFTIFFTQIRDLVVVEKPEESVSGEKWVATGKLSSGAISFGPNQFWSMSVLWSFSLLVPVIYYPSLSGHIFYNMNFVYLKLYLYRTPPSLLNASNCISAIFYTDAISIGQVPTTGRSNYGNST